MTIRPTNATQERAAKAFEDALGALREAFGPAYLEMADQILAEAKGSALRRQDALDLSEMLKAAP